jgi:hypothetical protein
MTLKNLKTAIQIELRTWRAKVGALLLIALPYGNEIKRTLAEELPALQPYIPENIYKFMGGALVVAGIALRLVVTFRAVKAANDA